MFDFDHLINLFFDNIKKLFFPENWINLDLKFSKSELFTMLYVQRKTELTMTELSEYLNTPMSTTTGIVDRLVKNNLLERTRSAADRRIVVVRLSIEGVKLLNQFKDAVSSYVQKALSEVTDTEKDFLIKIFFKVIHALGNLDTEIKGANDNTVKKINIE